MRSYTRVRSVLCKSQYAQTLSAQAAANQPTADDVVEIIARLLANDMDELVSK